MWSNDRLKIYFTSTRLDEPYYELPTTDIYSVAVTGGEPTKLTSLDMDAGALSISAGAFKLSRVTADTVVAFAPSPATSAADSARLKIRKSRIRPLKNAWPTRFTSAVPPASRTSEATPSGWAM